MQLFRQDKDKKKYIFITKIHIFQPFYFKLILYIVAIKS